MSKNSRTMKRTAKLVILAFSLSAALASAPRSAAAAEKLPPGVHTVILEETVWLIDRDELNDAIAQKTLNQRLEARILELEARPAPAPAPTSPKSTLVVGAWAVTVTGAFVAGAWTFSRLD